MRLSQQELAALPDTISRPGYDRARQQIGVVHFGIGAFHRAHQAMYFEAALNAGQTDWAILGVSLRSPKVAEQLNPQDGLYSVAVRSEDKVETRVVGAVQRVLIGQRHRDQVIAALAAPRTQLVTFTITEKGYCRLADGSLDIAQAGPDSVYHHLAAGLAARRQAGQGGLTLLSCDNLAHNGRQLQALLLDYLGRHDVGLAAWVNEACTFPCSMVDRIVPATTPSDLAIAAAALGQIDDQGHVVTEPFSQWVIEDRFAGARPDLTAFGVEMVADVTPYETAKLRMLNGAHSALAYLGLKAGHVYVHQAVQDRAIRPLIEALMLTEAAPTLAAAPGQDLGAYAQALLARFGNPALQHALSQIAMDGSQKIPQRWLETLAWHRSRGQTCPAIAAGLAAWFDHIKGCNGPVDDPRAAELASLPLGFDLMENVARVFGTR